MNLHPSAFLVASISLLCAVLSASAESDLKRILMKATNELLAGYGTSVTPHALASGFCFTREDRSPNKDKCADQPACKPASALVSHFSTADSADIIRILNQEE